MVTLYIACARDLPWYPPESMFIRLTSWPLCMPDKVVYKMRINEARLIKQQNIFIDVQQDAMGDIRNVVYDFAEYMGCLHSRAEAVICGRDNDYDVTGVWENTPSMIQTAAVLCADVRGYEGVVLREGLTGEFECLVLTRNLRDTYFEKFNPVGDRHDKSNRT